MKQYRLVLCLLIVVATCTGCQREHMRERLQYVSTCNRADTVFTEQWLPTVDSLVNYFAPSSHSWIRRLFSLPFREGLGVGFNEAMMAYYLQGRVHHDMGEAPQALDCYQHAAEQADTTRADCDLYTLYAVYGQMADLFHTQYLPDDEMLALKNAERIAWKDRDTLAALVAYDLRVRPYYHRNDTDSVLYIERHAREMYQKYGYPDKAAQAYRVTLSILLDRQAITLAGKAIHIYETQSNLFDHEGNIIEGGERYYYDKGRYLLAIGRQDSALHYFQKTLSAGYHEAGYRGFLSIYEQQGRSDSIAKYAKLFATANDSSYYHVNQEKVHQISAMYNYSHQQRIAEENKAKATRMKLYLLVFALLSAMMITLIVFAYHRVHARNMLRISQLLNDKADIQSLLSEKQGQLEAITTTKDTEIERITQESKQMLIDSHRENQLLRRQKEELDQQLAKFSRSDMEKAFSQTAIAQSFQAIRDEYPRKTPPTNLEWKQFTKTFRNYFSVYYSSITDGNSLTEDQLLVCMMLRLNYREYEMAFFMDTDKQRIDRIKSQINNKLFHTLNSSSLRKHLKRYY